MMASSKSEANRVSARVTPPLSRTRPPTLVVQPPDVTGTNAITPGTNRLYAPAELARVAIRVSDTVFHVKEARFRKPDSESQPGIRYLICENSPVSLRYCLS